MKKTTSVWWILFGAVAAGTLALPRAEGATDPALNPPFPRTLNHSFLTSESLPGNVDALGDYAGAIVQAREAVSIGDAFKDHYGESKALFAVVDWQAKDPDEGEDTLTGPALSTIFPGHSLYYEGAVVTQEVIALPGETDIHVDRVALFEEGDEVTLTPVRIFGGMPIFDPSAVEVVRVESIVPNSSGDGGTLFVARAQRGTQARSFSASYARAFVHVALPGSSSWRWNPGLLGPLDSLNRVGYEVVGDWVAGWLTTTHPSWDALILADARWHLDAAALGNPGADGRAPDTQPDATPDWGYSDGVNLFGLGELALSDRVRDRIGLDRAFLVGFAPTSGTITASPWPGPAGENGLWMERFPEGSLGGDFDSAFARLAFWTEHRPADVAPVSVVYTQADTEAYGGGSGGNAAFRLGLGAACMVDGWHTYTTAPDTPPYRDAVYAWDEYVAGTEGRPGWLGYPLEDAVRHVGALGALSTAQPIGQTGWTVQVNASGAAADPPQPVSGSTAIEVKVTGVAAPLPALDDIELASPDLGSIAAGTHTLHFSVRATFDDATPPPARDIQVGLQIASGPFVKAGAVPVGTEWEEYYLTLELDAVAGQASWVMKIGGPRGSLFLDLPEIRQGSADVFSRRFQGGVVLVNGSNAPFTFPLGASYRRIDGTVDPGVNDGAAGLEEEVVPGHDARFLLSDEPGPTPTPIPTVSPTPSPSPTITVTPTATVPPTLTPTPVITDYPTMTPIDWPTYTPTPSMSPSPSLTPSPSATAPPPGDIIEAVLDRQPFTTEERQAMDRNSDGEVDIADLMWLLSP